MYENGPAGEVGFSVSGNVKSHTKVAEKKTNATENITVYDTKGFLDTSTELADEYNNSKDSRKIQIIEEIMDALNSIQTTGVHAILLVINKGRNRFDISDKDIIDNLSNYVFTENIKKKVYLVFTHCPKKLRLKKNLAMEWFNEQCKTETSGGEEVQKTFTKYSEVVENDANRIIFLNNKNPDDEAEGDEEIEKCKTKNRINAATIIKYLRQDGEETVTLQSKYEGLLAEWNNLKKEGASDKERIRMYLLKNYVKKIIFTKYILYDFFKKNFRALSRTYCPKNTARKPVPKWREILMVHHFVNYLNGLFSRYYKLFF